MKTPRKKVISKPAKVRPMVPAAVAQERLTKTTIEMLRKFPFDQVTARELTKRAGLTLPTIARNFGSMAGLFSHVAETLLENAIKRQSGLLTQTITFDPDFILRSKLIAWLLAEGADPKIFKRDIFEQYSDRYQTEIKTETQRTTFTFMQLMETLGQGFAIFSETMGLTRQQIADGLELVAEFRKRLPEIERSLGWDKQK